MTTVEDAKHAVAILNENLGTDEEPKYHALDTEVSHIDVDVPDARLVTGT